MPNNSVHKLTAEELPAALAKFIAEKQAAAIARRGKFVVALSGGSMPKVLGAALSGKHGKFKWPKWHIFYADERCVPLDHTDSNHKAVSDTLLALPGVKVPAEQVYSLAHMPADAAGGGVGDAPRRYTTQLEKVFGRTAGVVPQFDLLLLGMGPDGHTASLFPGHALLQLGRSGAATPWVAGLEDSPKPPSSRITLTLPVLRAAYSVAFVSGGAAKAPALASILAAGKGADDDDMLPAGRITCAHGPVHWFVDPPAAEQLPPSAL